MIKITTICMAAMFFIVATADTQPTLIETTLNVVEIHDFEFYDLHRQINVKLTKKDIRLFVSGLIEAYLHDKISTYYPCLDDDQRVTALVG